MESGGLPVKWEESCQLDKTFWLPVLYMCLYIEGPGPENWCRLRQPRTCRQVAHGTFCDWLQLTMSDSDGLRRTPGSVGSVQPGCARPLMLGAALPHYEASAKNIEERSSQHWLRSIWLEPVLGQWSYWLSELWRHLNRVPISLNVRLAEKKGLVLLYVFASYFRLLDL